MTVTGDQVFEAFTTDPSINGPEDPQLKMMEPFIKALPDILSDLLDKPFGAEVLFESKLRFLKYSLENGMLDRARTAMSAVFGDDTDEQVDTLGSIMKQMVEYMGEIGPNLPQVLAAQGLTERDAMLAPEIGFNDAMRAKYMAGDLTLDHLLAHQPGVIIVNNK